MADKKLNQLTVAAAFTSTCSVAGSDSATPTGSFEFPKSVFDSAYVGLTGAQTVAGVKTFSSAIGIGSAGDVFLSRLGANTAQFVGADLSSLADLALGNCQANQFLVPSGLIRIRDAGTITIGEIATPSAPPAATAVLYTKNVGGKVALFVLFPSGAEQQIKIEA